MAGVQHLLRKAAIEKMASPEQLDMAMRVTSPMSWLALVTFGTLIASAVAASVIVQMPVLVEGSGILLRGDTVRTIQVTANGRIRSLEVEVGDEVAPGQLIAQLDLPELESQIRGTEDRIADLQSQESARDAQLARLESSYRQQLADLQARRKNIEELVEKGFKTRNDLSAIDAQIANVRARMLQDQLGETGRENQLAEERRRLEQLREQLATNAEVRSKEGGRVTAVLRLEGQLIQSGEVLVNLEDPEAEVHALIFVPFTEGKKIEPGMRVRISPTTVPPEEFGFIVGVVDSVSAQPVSPEEVKATLANTGLVQRFAQETPFRVRATPLLDPGTPSGFQWTSSAGPPQAIGANMPANAQIIVNQRKPISYVIPTVKKTLGMGG